jgi:hypothetical protein
MAAGARRRRGADRALFRLCSDGSHRVDAIANVAMANGVAMANLFSFAVTVIMSA